MDSIEPKTEVKSDSKKSDAGKSIKLSIFKLLNLELNGFNKTDAIVIIVILFLLVGGFIKFVL